MVLHLVIETHNAVKLTAGIRFVIDVAQKIRDRARRSRWVELNFDDPEAGTH